MKNRVIINTVPHSGTHLVSSILDIIGYSQALQFHWKTLSYRKVFLNWRTSLLPNNKDLHNTDRKFNISVTSPQLVREDLVVVILNKIKNNQYLLSHAPHSQLFEELLINLGFLGLSIIRDPRDMCLSMLNHIEQRPHHYAHDVLFHNIKNRYDSLIQVINGFEIFIDNIKRPFGNIVKMVNSITPWENTDNFMLLKFEDLVGARGSGSADMQFQSIQKILNHLDAEHLDVEEIANNSFGKSGTFRKGKINRWKTELNDDEKEIFKKYDDFIVSLGYEPTV